MTRFDSKYLHSDPLDWLLNDPDPSIRFLTRMEILGDNPGDDLYAAIVESAGFKRLVNKNRSILGNIKKFDIHYTGTIWCFAEAVERGLDRRTDIVKTTAEYIISNCQTPAGGFSLQWKPLTEVACRTGDMVRTLIRAGFTDQRIENGISWIARHQRHDGGWLHCPLAGACDHLKLILLNKPGNGLTRESNTQVTSCIYATIACSMALIEYTMKTGATQYAAQIRNSAEYFLRRSLFKNSHNAPMKPKNSWNHDFRLLGYPLLSQYDILYGLLFLARAGYSGDRRTGEAFNAIMSKQNSDGTWNMVNTGTGMMFGNEPRIYAGKKSPWVTLQVLRLLKHHPK